MTEGLRKRLANGPKNFAEAEEQLRRNRLERLGGEKSENYSAEQIRDILKLSRALGTVKEDIEMLGLNIALLSPEEQAALIQDQEKIAS